MVEQRCDPRRGEVWCVRFDSVGAEIKKTRPAVVVSSDAIGRTGLRIVVPVTEWNQLYAVSPWFVKLTPSPRNGLEKASAADCHQVKSVSVERFQHKIGAIAATELVRVVDGIALCIDYVPSE